MTQSNTDIILLREIVTAVSSSVQRSYHAPYIPPDSLGQVLIIHENFGHPVWELTSPNHFYRNDDSMFPTHRYFNGKIEERHPETQNTPKK